MFMCLCDDEDWLVVESFSLVEQAENPCSSVSQTFGFVPFWIKLHIQQQIYLIRNEYQSYLSFPLSVFGMILAIPVWVAALDLSGGFGDVYVKE